MPRQITGVPLLFAAEIAGAIASESAGTRMSASTPFARNALVYQSLGVYLSLIVVNCIILGRAEMYASKHGVVDSAIDGAGMGLGFTLAICAMAAIRETLGCGTFCGLPVPWFHENPIGILTMAPGGFFVFGCMIALINKISKGKAIKKKEFGCAGCPGCGKGACEGKEAAAK